MGCEPGEPWSGIGDCVRALRDAGHRISVDSLNPQEIEPAVRSGAELVLSVNTTNREAAVDWGCEVVVIPDDFSTLAGRNSRAELEWVYLDSYYLDPQNEHEYQGHSLLNLRITSDLTPRWSAGLRLTNLLDEDYAERADFGFGEYRYFVGQPLGAYLEIKYQFGEV